MIRAGHEDLRSPQLDAVLAVMDKQLAGNPVIAGNAFTLADIGSCRMSNYGMNTPAKDIVARHAHVMAWRNKVSERPTWRKVAGR